MEQWRRAFSTRHRHCGAWTSEVQQAGGSGTIPSSILFPARGGFHRDLKRKKKHKQSVLFCFLDLSSSSAFSLLCRCFFCRCPIWWLGGLLLLCFSGWRWLWLTLVFAKKQGRLGKKKEGLGSGGQVEVSLQRQSTNSGWERLEKTLSISTVKWCFWRITATSITQVLD